MTKCEHCGFDPEEEFIKMVGAPCGYRGCTSFMCCTESWKIHMETYHKREMMREITGFLEPHYDDPPLSGDIKR